MTPARAKTNSSGRAQVSSAAGSRLQRNRQSSASWMRVARVSGTRARDKGSSRPEKAPQIAWRSANNRRPANSEAKPAKLDGRKARNRVVTPEPGEESAG